MAFPEIPAPQIALLQALKKTGKPIVALVSSGRPLVLTAIEPLADAIVQCWILGTETGNAVADILSGAYNPSAKTVMTFPMPSDKFRYTIMLSIPAGQFRKVPTRAGNPATAIFPINHCILLAMA